MINYNMIITYLIAINIITYMLIALFAKINLLKGKEYLINIILIITSILGGFVGSLVGSEMFDYRKDDKIFKRWIPFIIFVEVCILIYIIWERNK